MLALVPVRGGAKLRAKTRHLRRDALRVWLLSHSCLAVIYYGRVKTKPPNPRAVQLHDEYERLIVAFVFVDCVVIDEVSGAVHDRAIAIYFDTAKDMPGMPEHDVGANIDHTMRKRYMRWRRQVAPVRSPVCRDDYNIGRPPGSSDRIEEPGGAIFFEIDRHIGDSWPILSGFPMRLVIGERDKRDFCASGCQSPRSERRRQVWTGARMYDTRVVEDRERV